MLQGDDLSTPVLDAAFAAAGRQLLRGDSTTKDIADTMFVMEREALAQEARWVLRHAAATGLRDDSSKNKIPGAGFRQTPYEAEPPPLI